MCRCPMGGLTSSELEASSPAVQETPFQFCVTPALREQQRQMAALLEKQREKGGVIDVEEERKKYLLSEAVNINPRRGRY